MQGGYSSSTAGGEREKKKGLGTGTGGVEDLDTEPEKDAPTLISWIRCCSPNV